MSPESHNVNVSLEAEFFTYYHLFYLKVLNAISEWCEGEISEKELSELMEKYRADAFKHDAEMMTQYEYLKRNYEVGGIIKAWYLRVAH